MPGSLGRLAQIIDPMGGDRGAAAVASNVDGGSRVTRLGQAPGDPGHGLLIQEKDEPGEILQVFRRDALDLLAHPFPVVHQGAASLATRSDLAGLVVLPQPSLHLYRRWS